MAATSSASNAPTPELPPEDWTLVFSNLDRQTAGRIASVCRMLQVLSQHNHVWKPIHLREWQYREKWISQQPTNWKAYAQKVARAAHLALAIEYDDDEEYEDECRRRYSHYWQLGLVNEGILQLSPDHEKYEDRVFQSCVIAGEHQIASGLLESCQAIPAFLEILLHIEKKELQTAYDCYLAHRQEFITNDPKMGWWICTILQSEKVVISEQNKIFFPNTPKQTQFALLKASALIWMQRGLEKRAAISIECLARTLSSFGQRKDLTHFLEFFFNEFEEKGMGLSLPISFYDFLEQVLRHSTFAIDNPLTRALINGIQQSSSLQTEVDLGARLALLLSKVAKKKKPEFSQFANLLISILKKQETTPPTRCFRYEDLLNIAQLVLSQEIDSAYPLILQVLAKYKPFKVDDQIQKRSLHYQLQMQRCLNQYSQAVVTFTKLYRLNVEDFDEIYDILKESEEACKKMVAVDSEFQEIQSARAYAYYKLGRYVDAARTLFKYHLGAQERWKIRMSQRDLLAGITLSRVFDNVKGLEYFYFNILNKFHDNPYTIYHNLAGCLFLRGFPEKALEHIETAIQKRPEIAKAHAIKALALKQLGCDTESKAAFNDAQRLDPNKFRTIYHKYTDTDLLVTPSNR